MSPRDTKRVPIHRQRPRVGRFNDNTNKSQLTFVVAMDGHCFLDYVVENALLTSTKPLHGKLSTGTGVTCEVVGKRGGFGRGHGGPGPGQAIPRRRCRRRRRGGSGLQGSLRARLSVRYISIC